MQCLPLPVCIYFTFYFSKEHSECEGARDAHRNCVFRHRYTLHIMLILKVYRKTDEKSTQQAVKDSTVEQWYSTGGTRRHPKILFFVI
jgi:predicted NAD/FAD-binding protein